MTSTFVFSQKYNNHVFQKIMKSKLKC